MRGGLGLSQLASERGGAAVAGSAAFRGSSWGVSRPDVVVMLLAAVVCTYVWRYHSLFPATGVFRPTLLLALVVAVACVRVPISAVGRRLRSPVLVLLAVMILLGAVGLPFALDQEASRRWLTAWVLPGALMATLVAVATRTPRDVLWLLRATLVAAVGYLVVLFARGGSTALTNPAVTVFYDRNDLALMLVVLLPVALDVARRGQRGLVRALAGLCFLFFAFAIVRGGSRGGLVGLVVVLSYVLFTFRGLPRGLRVWSVIAAVGLVVAAGPEYWARIRTIFQPATDYNWTGQTYGRGSIWRRGLHYIEERPLVGVGIGGFPAAERELSAQARQRMMAGRPVEPILNPHNIFLQAAAELGLPGLVVFVVLLAQMARMLRRLRRWPDADPEVGEIAHVLLACLIGYVVCGFFLSAAYFPFFYLLIGLVAALAAMARPLSAPPPWGGLRGGVPAARGGALPPYEAPAAARW